MALKPEASVLGGLAAWWIPKTRPATASPSQADMKGLPQGSPDIDKANRSATWLSIVAVCGISLLARDTGILLIGSGAVVGMKVWSDHSTWTESIVGRYLSPAEAASAGTQATGPAPVETQPYEMFAESQFLEG